MDFADIHTHILPGVDDGSKDYDTSVAMLKLAYGDGTRTVVLTPHYKGHYRIGTSADIKAVFSEFSAAVSGEFPGLRLCLGSECLYEHGLAKKLRAGEALTMAGTKYVLTEFLPSAPASYILESLDDLAMGGFKPILAHADRCSELVDDYDTLCDIYDSGALIQLNAEGVIGNLGSKVKKFCKKALKDDIVSFIATDAHDTSKRTPTPAECYRYVSKKYGSGTADAVFGGNFESIILGK